MQLNDVALALTTLQCVVDSNGSIAMELQYAEFPAAPCEVQIMLNCVLQSAQHAAEKTLSCTPANRENLH